METTKDSLLYAIEVSKSMLTRGTLKDVLAAVRDSVRERMIAYPMDNTGVLLYGVSGHKNNCKILLDLKPQNSRGIKLLFRLLEDETFFEESVVPAAGNTTSLGDVFFNAGVMFEQEKAKSFRRLVLVTDNDQPHDPETRLFEVAKIKSYDLVQKNVTIVPVFVSYPDRRFEVSKMWEDFYYTPEFYIDSSNTKLEPINGSPKDILTAISNQEVPRRPAFRNCIQLGDLKIDVRAYVLYKQQLPSQKYDVSVDGDKPVVAVSRTHYIVEESGREVEKEDMTRAFKFGKSRIVVDQETLDSLKDFGEPAIRILGFQKRSEVVLAGHLSHSLFIYPWDVLSKGSIRAFIALWRSLLNKDKVAIAQCILRTNSAPCIAALYPSPEVLSPDGHQTSPPGIYLVTLPYMDDIRDIPQNTIHLTAEEGLVDLAGAVVDKLTMPQGYRPERYRNPKLLWVSSIIEAQALSREMPKGAVDGTLPKYRSIETRSGAAIRALNEVLTKIPPKEEKAEPPAKRVKHADISIEHAESLAANQNLDKLTVDQLKGLTAHAGVPEPQGRQKKHLVQALMEFFKGM
ncbi:ATP-dependent DNA helicase II subunit 1 [Wickerhamiella sorbophila]|uniref:ATP-dependent DNA helicase II subunit 1 n=1 Tax=Wickerhamiella sorbophila TaxID=45607 RepID=A0A2T0FPL9_9ASCO|nr:ATP-dependent DNA helicase II subunit 1 [Wickerhamiella sorbophila]PRT56934.1 ATP-dependent DNA helicase II subunit 1 [Wickerhamiella sorbophila]